MSERAYDVLTIADACVDLLIDLGETVPQFGQVELWVEDYFLEMGGSACIFACQAAKLGLRVGILGVVGDDPYGQLVLRRLGESGVDTRFMAVNPALKTGLGATLCRPSGDRAILTYGGSLNALGPDDVSDAFLALGRHLHYCSYYLQTKLLPAVPDLLRRARALGLTISLDTNWDPAGVFDSGLQAVLEQVDLFFPNEQEALAITGAKDAETAASRLLERVPVVAIKLGEKGSLVASREGRWFVPVEPVIRPGDTVGAGDNYDAGFVVGWLRGLPLEACAALGNACGRASTLARGGVLGQLKASDLSFMGR